MRKTRAHLLQRLPDGTLERMLATIDDVHHTVAAVVTDHIHGIAIKISVMATAPGTADHAEGKTQGLQDTEITDHHVIMRHNILNIQKSRCNIIRMHNIILMRQRLKERNIINKALSVIMIDNTIQDTIIAMLTGMTQQNMIRKRPHPLVAN